MFLFHLFTILFPKLQKIKHTIDHITFLYHWNLKLEINNDEENLRSKICEEHDDFNVLPW